MSSCAGVLRAVGLSTHRLAEWVTGSKMTGRHLCLAEWLEVVDP